MKGAFENLRDNFPNALQRYENGRALSTGFSFGAGGPALNIRTEVNKTSEFFSAEQRFLQAQLAFAERFGSAGQAGIASRNLASNPRSQAGNIPLSTTNPIFPLFQNGSPNASVDAFGGFQAILHPDEAVIPLPDGRRVPVDLSGPVRAAQRNLESATGTEVRTRRSQQGMALQATPVMLSNDRPIPVSIVDAPRVEMTRDVRNEQPMRENGMMNNARNIADPSSQGDSPVSDRQPMINITMNIKTPDADSFRRSQEQITRDMAMKIRDVSRRNGIEPAPEDPTIRVSDRQDRSR
jgi:hypothetical protein